MTTSTAVLSRSIADELAWLTTETTQGSSKMTTWEWVYAEGVAYPDIAPVPDDRRGPIGHCFSHSQMLATNDPSLTYCEGYACSEDGGLLEHAWTITADGRVLDPTWPAEPHGYYGIVLDVGWVRRTLGQDRSHSVLFGDWMRGYEFHCEGLPDAARPSSAPAAAAPN